MSPDVDAVSEALGISHDLQLPGDEGGLPALLAEQLEIRGQRQLQYLHVRQLLLPAMHVLNLSHPGTSSSHARCPYSEKYIMQISKGGGV